VAPSLTIEHEHEDEDEDDEHDNRELRTVNCEP
jgi:hypothetical protein